MTWSKRSDAGFKTNTGSRKHTKASVASSAATSSELDKHRNGILVAGSKAENQMTPLEKMERSYQGLSKSDLETLKSRTALDYDKLSRALSVTRATLINKKGIQKYSASISERILSIADIYSYGYEVFEDEDRFNSWMFKPNQALGGKMPYDIINNQFGREEVKNLIGRIEHGVFS